MSKEQLLRIYAQHIKNLEDVEDETGINEELVLLTRESVADETWTPEQQAQVDRLDDQLVARWAQIAEVLPNPNFLSNRGRWWWFLHEGPQVREEAKALAR